MTDRIAQLERMVISLVDSNKTTGASEFDRMPSPVMTMLPQSPGMPAPRDATNFQTPRHWGQIRVGNYETAYVPSTHWSIILEEVTMNLDRKMQWRQLMADCLVTDFGAEEYVFSCI